MSLAYERAVAAKEVAEAILDTIESIHFTCDKCDKLFHCQRAYDWGANDGCCTLLP